jgi:hypothetical protein
MIDEAAQRLAPIQSGGRRFLVQYCLDRLFVNQRDPLVAVLFPETLQDVAAHFLRTFGQAILERARLIVGYQRGVYTDGTALTFDKARADFERAWKIFLSKRTEADFEAWRDQRDWTERKYAMWERGERLLQLWSWLIRPKLKVRIQGLWPL